MGSTISSFRDSSLDFRLTRGEDCQAGDEESRNEFIKESVECEGELKQIARRVYARYGVTDLG